MGKFVLIGGVTPPSSLDIIDEEIIRLTNNRSPKVLYVSTAGEDDPDYCDFLGGYIKGVPIRQLSRITGLSRTMITKV